MTYDFHGSWDSVIGHNSPLYPRPEETGDAFYFNVVRTLFEHFSKITLNKYAAYINSFFAGLCNHSPIIDIKPDSGFTIFTSKHPC